LSISLTPFGRVMTTRVSQRRVYDFVDMRPA
jgi:hypothetical protein